MTGSAARVWSVVSLGGLCLAVALAIWLRMRQMTFQDLWWDEGGSFYHAHTSIAELTTTKDFRLDPHPPVYYLLLHGWLALVGTSLTTGRMLSVIFGVLAVPLGFWVAWLVYGRVTAVISAFLIAINPALIFYSQEVRMYSLTPFEALGSVLATVYLLDNNARRAVRIVGGGAWMALAVLCLYTQYYLAFLLVAEVVALAAARLASPQKANLLGRVRAIAPVLLAAFAVGACYIPWVIHMPLAQAAAMGSPLLPAPSGTPREFWPFFWETWRTYTSGAGGPLAFHPGIEVWFAALALCGATCWGWSTRRLTVLCVVVTPLLLSYALHQARPFFFSRYIVYLVPSLLVLVGAGVTRLGAFVQLGARTLLDKAAQPGAPRRLQYAAAALALLFVGIVCVPLGLAARWTLAAQQYTARTAFSSSDYLPLVREIGRLGQPGDTLDMSFTWQIGYTLAYSGIRWPMDSAVVLDDQSLMREVDKAETAGHAAWWMGYSPDQKNWVNWKAGKVAHMAHRSLDEWNGDSLLVRFGRPLPGGSLLARQVPGATPPVFGGLIALEGYDVQRRQTASSTMLELRLQWRALRAPDRDYTVFVHALDATGKLVGQRDSQPLSGLDPTSVWQPGGIVLDSTTFAWPPTAVQIEAGLYDANTGKRLARPGEGDRVLLPLP
jgi:hypothetical protein